MTYWTTRIAELGPFDRMDWEHELRRLIEDGIFDVADEAQFHHDFTNTGHSAVPRPGIKVSRDGASPKPAPLISPQMCAPLLAKPSAPWVSARPARR